MPEQIAERFAGMLEPGYVDHIALQVPTGDMTYDEARRTVELFGARSCRRSRSSSPDPARAPTWLQSPGVRQAEGGCGTRSRAAHALIVIRHR